MCEGVRAIPPQTVPTLMRQARRAATAQQARSSCYQGASSASYAMAPYLLSLKQAVHNIRPTRKASAQATAEDKERVNLYRKSPEVREARKKTLETALAAIATQWQRNGKQGAVAIDLDETLLDNLDYYQTYRNYEQKAWDSFLADPSHTSFIPETVAFVQGLNQLGIPVYFTSARRADALRQATDMLVQRLVDRYQLTNVKGTVLKGDQNVDGMSYNSRNSQGQSVGKNPAYEGILRKEGRILAVVGDQESDAADARMGIPFFKVPHFYTTGQPSLWQPASQGEEVVEEILYQPSARWAYLA